MSIRLFYWNTIKNFGDQISPDIVSHFAKTPAVRVGVRSQPKMLAVGSILDAAREGDLIWGSGVHPRRFTESHSRGMLLAFREQSAKIDKCVFSAVRGPITLDYVRRLGGICPEVFGDPAVLAPLVYPKTLNPGRRFTMVHHFSEVPPSGFPSTKVVSPSLPWREVVDEICQGEVVISSSLHGLIVAEAYGIPAIFARTSHEGIMKYIDYYGATNRFPVMAPSFEAATNKKASSPPCFAAMSEALMSSLPTDLSRYANKTSPDLPR